MPISEHMKGLITTYLMELNIKVEDQEISVTAKFTAEEAATFAHEIAALLEPEFDAVVKSAEKAGYDKASHREDLSWWRRDLDRAEEASRRETIREIE